MLRIHTRFNRPQTVYKRVKTVSLTIPDQTLSLKVMVTKYVKGLPIAAPTLNGIYTEDEHAIDFEKLDLAEQEEAILRASDELSNVKGKIRKDEEEKAAEAKKQAEKQEAELKELREFKNKQLAL